MKNMFKMLGIIAIIAMIVSMGGCAADPEDQVDITISGIPTGAEGNYALIILFNQKSGKSPTINAVSDISRAISGGTAQGLMLKDFGGDIFDKDGPYKVGIYINEGAPITGSNIGNAQFFYTPSQKSISKGANSFAAGEFFNEGGLTIAQVYGGSIPDATINASRFSGTYVTTYKVNGNANAASIVETIALTPNSFIISDDDNDRLVFTITEWNDTVSTPSTYSTTYPNAFKFTGTITSSTNGYLGPNSQTGRGFTQEDVTNHTSCWMYLYFSNDGKVVRTPFSKAGAAENTNVVLEYTSGPLRIYTEE